MIRDPVRNPAGVRGVTLCLISLRVLRQSGFSPTSTLAFAGLPIEEVGVSGTTMTNVAPDWRIDSIGVLSRDCPALNVRCASPREFDGQPAPIRDHLPRRRTCRTATVIVLMVD